MSAPPTGPPPSPEFLSESKGSQILPIIIVFPTLAFLVVCLRLYTRFRIVKNPSWEDVTILLALVFSIATSICQGFQVHNGMGRHVQALTMQQGINSFKALFASILMYNFGLTLTKISILLQFLRISIDRNVRIACYVLMVIVVLYCIETFFTGTFSCYPVAKFWDTSIPGKCLNTAVLYYANAGINIAQDFSLVILPMFILKSLRLPRREKISLMLILGLGGFASLGSIFRLHSLYVLQMSKDPTWDNPGAATWSCMELNIGILCASLPTLRAFFARFFPQTFSSQYRSRDSQFYRKGSGSTQSRQSAVVNRDGNVLANDDIPADIEKRQPPPREETFLVSDSETDITRDVARPEPTAQV